MTDTCSGERPEWPRLTRLRMASAALSPPLRQGTDDDRGRRLLASASGNLLALHRDVNARRADAVDQLDRARQFAFERPHLGDLLHEGGQAHDPSCRRARNPPYRSSQALLCSSNAGAGRLTIANHDGTAVEADVEIDACLFQRSAHAGNILRVEAGIENYPSWAGSANSADSDEKEHGNSGQTKRCEPPRPQSEQICPQPVQDVYGRHSLLHCVSRQRRQAAKLAAESLRGLAPEERPVCSGCSGWRC